MKLEPKELTQADYDRWQRLTRTRPFAAEDWREIAEFVLDAMGALKIVEYGDVRLWRHAIAERSDGPVPPLNLPLSIWEAFLANPFSSITFHLANGSTRDVERWEDVFYSWHSRRLGIIAENSFVSHAANDVIAVSRTEPSPCHVTILERLRWFKNAQPFSPLCVRTKWKHAILVEEADHFEVDHSGSVLAIARPNGTEIVHIMDIVSVRSARGQSAILNQIVEAQKAGPFRPFRINFCNGKLWTVDRPETLIVSAKRLFLAEGKESASGYEDVREMRVEWLDSVELMPTETK